MLITGASGFVGRNLLHFLSQISHNYQIFTPSRQEVDFTNPLNVKEYISRINPQIIVHLAGEVGGIQANRKRKADLFYNNSMMTNILFQECANNGKVEKIVSLGAGCGYPAPYLENREWEETNKFDVIDKFACRNSGDKLVEFELFSGFPEHNSYGYSMAKKMLVVAAMAYQEQYGLNSTILIPANLYGPHDYFNSIHSHVVPAIIGKIHRGKLKRTSEIEVWGSGMAVREFLFVDDLCCAIIDAINIEGVGPYNVGTGLGTTIKELVNLVVKEIGYEGKIVYNHDFPDGSRSRIFSLTKFRSKFGYIPATSLEDGIKKTVEWYEENGQKNE